MCNLITIIEKAEPFEHPNCIEITKEEYDWLNKSMNWFIPM